jgi:integrase
MERKKELGIFSTSDGGFLVDRRYCGQRIRRYGFKTLKEAKTWMIEEMEKVRVCANSGARDTRTFEDAATRYLVDYSKKPSITTDIFNLKPVMPFIAKLRLDQVHDDTLKPFIAARKSTMKKRRISKTQYEMRPLTNKTVNLSLSVVRRILNLCARSWRDDEGRTWLQTAPKITLLPLVDSRPPRPIMWDEQRRFLPLLPSHLASMALFTLNTGVRDDVVVNLRWHWEIYLEELGTSIFVVPKTHVKGEFERKTDMVLVCNSVAQKVIEAQRGKNDEFVFCYRRELGKTSNTDKERDWKPIETMNNTAWQNARLNAGLGDLHVHDMRHTVGMRLREAGVRKETISAILWHSNESITDHYSMAMVREIFDALEQIKDEGKAWNKSLQTLIFEARAKSVQKVSKWESNLQRKTG